MTTIKALVVEHDEKTRQIIDEVLLAIGHRYEIATSLAGAHELLAANGYAYVLLNCMIPARPGGTPRRQNAENFLDDLKRIKGSSMPPVIVMFDPMPEVDEEFKVSWSCDLAMRGATRFIQKPFRTEGRTLDRVIKKVLAGQRWSVCPFESFERQAHDDARVPPSSPHGESAAHSEPPQASEVPHSEDGDVEVVSPPGPDERLASIPNEAIEIDGFMARFCEQRSRENRMYRKRALLAAARHGTITLPPLAGPRKHGQPNRYFVHDLLTAWQGFLDEGVNLPPLRPQSPYCCKGVEQSCVEAASEPSPATNLRPAGLKAAMAAVRV